MAPVRNIKCSVQLSPKLLVCHDDDLTRITLKPSGYVYRTQNQNDNSPINFACRNQNDDKSTGLRNDGLGTLFQYL
ncbi:unnamed protein product [Cercopithifilaria johnstoni]|uniref:Uncharacterized protein n=1 Tax=Cercopithifilaria johnstoni TaxID=2874296 RepID=A0A8J2MUX2_9BILA|nr:unnamed protein product [Cercopithifilaria johnstoni]